MPIGSRYYFFPMTQLNADSSGSGETASHFDGRLLIGNIFAGTISSSFDRMNQTMACRLVMVLIPWITIARCTKLFPFPWFNGTISSPWLRRGTRPAWYETISFALFFFPVPFLLRDSFLIPNETRSEDTRYDTMSSFNNYYMVPPIGWHHFLCSRSVGHFPFDPFPSVSINPILFLILSMLLSACSIKPKNKHEDPAQQLD